uniref:Solute carrier family 5 member 8 n=1 Tax=Amphilophus citrinellus TaxID=61819 RepID=A0A3Q0RJ60_AMPCI
MSLAIKLPVLSLCLFPKSAFRCLSSQPHLTICTFLCLVSAKYLELRFNRATRLLGTMIFFINALLYTGLVIYAPALALNQGMLVQVYSTQVHEGFLHEVYFEVTQLTIGIMFAGYMSVIIKSVILKGGISTIFFDINPLRRHTFWTLVIGGTFGWSSIYGTNQAQVQRYNSCKSVTNARLALFINALGLTCTLTSSVLSGLCIYSFYKDCDPWTAGQVSSPDQLLPYLVMDILTDHRGLLGLFFAAVYSASLSTVSSSISALAAVTVEDLIKPCTNLSEKKLLLISKGLMFLRKNCRCLFKQAASVILGLSGGPLLGLFSLGVLCPFANSKGGLLGLVAGLAASLCVTIGDLISPSPPEMTRPLSLSTEGCNFTSGSSLNWTTALPTEPSPLTTTPGQNTDDIRSLYWHTPSYLYFVVIGCLTSVIVGVIISLLTGGLRETVDPRLTLMKEDTLSYQLFKLVKDRVRAAGKRYQKQQTDDSKCSTVA